MRLYNTLTQIKQTFTSLHPNEVKMYACGITPYDTTHLGHAFTYMAFDVLQRVLTFKGYTVTYTQNVTDIDDDIIKRARETNQNWQELGEFWTKKFLNDLHDLNIIMPTYYVKATDSIPTMLKIIDKLVQDGWAYEKDGNVYFRVSKDPEYGKLSRYSREEMTKLSKERGADPDDPRKEDPLDFILWQKSKEGEPIWDPKDILKTGQTCLPAGRPGWHIECSAMNYDYLGEQIDIHGGGSDLLYPHHESEIAQSEHFTGKKPFAKFFMHTGAVAYQGKKMSKSLGNLVLISDLLKNYSPNAIRYLLLSHHYREPWEFQEKELERAEEKVKKIQEARSVTKEAKNDNESASEAFIQALEDDLDTPKALNILETEANPQTQKEMWRLLGFIYKPRH